MSSPNKYPLTNTSIFSLIGRLARGKDRHEAAEALASLLGVDHLILFIYDSEVESFLPAQGFFQTYPNSQSWRKFLNACEDNQLFKGLLPYPKENVEISAVGLTANGTCTIVLLGGTPNDAYVQQLTELLPLLSMILTSEEQAMSAKAELELTKKSYGETQEIAKKLDEARRDLQKTLIKKDQIEEHFRALIEKTSDGITLISPEGNVLYTSPAMPKIIGYTDEEFRANNPFTLIHPNDRERVYTLFLELLPQFGSTVHVSYQYKHKNGEYVWLDSVVSNLIHEPSVQAIVVNYRDISEQMRFDDELKASERKFRALADNIPNLAWMANPDGYIYWYNKRWHEYTGKSSQEMEGWGWQSVHDPNTLPDVLREWKSSIETKKPFEMVFPLLGSDGVFRPFLTRIVPIFDEEGTLIQWFGSNTDITEQKELERQKDDFLGIASHELKTPVTSIKAYGQVLQELFRRKGDMNSVDHLSKMDKQIDRLTTLITDLLDVTKIQAGKIEFHEENFGLNPLVTSLTEQLQLTTRTHRLEKDLEPLPLVFGDQERIGQVVTNLISNAIKYSPQANKVSIKTTLDGEVVTFSVKDYGIGIPKDKQDRVFEQFYRVSGAKEITFPGLGLGLYVSSEIIKREGGKIWFTSEEGKGSTFYFSLPISKEGEVINT